VGDVTGHLWGRVERGGFVVSVACEVCGITPYDWLMRQPIGRAGLIARIRSLLVVALVAAIEREHGAWLAAQRRIDMGHDDCVICLAARR
jgi:hypothetical protein